MRFMLIALALVACGKTPTPPPATPSWAPGTVYQTERTSPRGLLDRRGLIHAHSYFSHDACDNTPRFADGGYNQPCYEDFRRGLCQSKHDFVFLTDHPTLFADNEYPDTLLYRASYGDSLVMHGGLPTANWLACPDGGAPLVMAGTEGDQMAVGLDEHAVGRNAVYSLTTADSIAAVKDKHAVALVAHTEQWTADELSTLPLDGFEMYNLHANTLLNGGQVAELVLTKIEKGDFTGLPTPDAFFSVLNLEDPRYLSTWGTVLSRGVNRVTTMGTDCHRNTFPQLMEDGERVDSYRRMMIMFSNHLLVSPRPDGSYDDVELKAALKAGRLYGVFEFLGYASGFDYSALEGGATFEMGASVSLASGVTLKAVMPKVLGLDATAQAPTLTMRVLRAIDGGWEEIATTQAATLSVPVTKTGAYRVEVRMTPKHLKPFIGGRTDFLKADRPWVYSNAIYVVP